MDNVELEIIVFSIGGFSFGAEVSGIISVVRTEEGTEQRADSCEQRAKEDSLLSSTFSNEYISPMDLSKRMGMRETPVSHASSVEINTRDNAGLVILVNTTAGTKGVIVDSVKGSAKIPLEQIEPLPGFLKSRMQTDCIWGIAKLEHGLVILLDLDRYILDDIY